MNGRLHYKMTEALIDREDEDFGLYFHQFLEQMLTPELHKQLCAERYQVLMEDIFAPIVTDSGSDDTYRKRVDGLWTERRPNTYSMATDWFKEPTPQNRATFISFILCYAAVGVVPVSQPVIGACVEKFLAECGGWVTTTHKHKDAMLYRLPGCFEGGKRR